MNEIVVVFVVLAIAMLTLVLILICMQLYEIFEEPAIEKRMQRLRKPTQPWVTVLVYARDNEATIEAALSALIKNKYHHFDIVVVNDRSKDATQKCIQNSIARSDVPITVIQRRKRDTAQAALEAGFRKSKHGKVIISLRATTIVSRDFIKRAVATKHNRDVVSMRLYEPSSTTTLSGITRSLSALLWQQTQRAVVSDRRNITPIPLAVSPNLFTVVLFIGMVSVSILTNETIIIWYSWILVTFYVCAVIWLRSEGLFTKVKLTFSAVPAVFLLPVSSFIQALSQFRSRI